MNLLSIGASLGVIQAVFERGWLGGLFGAQAGPIDAFIPVLAFAIVFGLSMDYEVFLISRVHEEWQRAPRRQRRRQGGPRPHRARDHRRGRGDGRGVRRVRDQRQPGARDVRAGDGERRVARRARGQDAPAARRPPAARPHHLGAAALARPAASAGRDRGRAGDQRRSGAALEPAFEAGS